MKLRILDVPAQYATSVAEHTQGGVVRPVVNGGPGVMPSVLSSPNQAHQALVDLAVQDGWEALYDPTNPNTVITDADGKITQILDSLGNYPPLQAQLYGNETGPADPTQMGSLTGFTGTLYLELDESANISATTVVTPTQPGVFYGSYSDLTVPENIQQANIYANATGDLEVYQSDQQASSNENYRAAVSMGQPNIVTLGVEALLVGNHRLQPDDDVQDPVQVSGQEVFGLASPGISMAGLALSQGSMPQDALARMTSLLAQLSGAGQSTPALTQGFVPSGYASLDDQGHMLTSFRADRPEQLASITKVLTCFLARKLVPNEDLDILIEVVPQYVPEPTTRVPVVTPGDHLSWRDAFHGSLMVSHNQITDTIAHHAGLRLNPGSVAPIDDFVAHMNTVVRSQWGWDEAVFTTPQGRYDCILTPRHVCELLLKVADEDPWLVNVMGTTHHEYVVYWADPERTDDTARWTNIVRDGQSGVPYPELIGGKSGDTPAPTKRSVAVLWRNPSTGRLTASCVLDTGSTSGHRWNVLRDIMTTTRRYYAAPTGWQPQSAGTMLSWEHDGTTPYVAVTQEPGIDRPAAVSPFSVYHAPLPRVQAGDQVTVRATNRAAASDNVARVSIQARIIGGRWSGGTDTIRRIDTATQSWATRTLSGEVTRNGVLQVTLTDERQSATPGFHTRNLEVIITTPEGAVYAYDLDVIDYHLTQDAQPLDSLDTSGGVGEIKATIRAPERWPITEVYGHDWFDARRFQLISDRDSVTLAGHITGVQAHDATTLVLNATTALGPLNAYNVQTHPYQGPLVGLIQEYFTLASDHIPAMTADPALQDRMITAPGWNGELWHHLKMLCAAERIQLEVTPNGIHVRPAPVHSDMPTQVLSRRHDNPSTQLAQYVEVIHRRNRRVQDILVYPHGGWDQDVGILSVNPGEYVVHTLELQTSLESIVQPTHVDYVSRLDRSRSQYTITGDDGQPVSAQEFANAGGRISFRIGDDRRTIEVIMQGPRGLVNDDRKYIRTFSMASRFGDAPYKYSTLRILGTGVMWDEKPIRFPTGVKPSQTGTEIGAVIDNPFLSSMSQVVQAGTQAARKYSGFDPELTVTTTSDRHIAVGGVVNDHRINYRVVSVDRSPVTTTISGKYHLTHQVHEQLQQGTYDQVTQRNQSMIDSTYRDEIGKGKHVL